VSGWRFDYRPTADPAVDYPSLFGLTREGIGRNPVSLPTLGPPVRLRFFENLAIDGAGRLTISARRREPTFGSYADYRDRLRSALASIIANGRPHEPVVPLSSGYDGTAVAALAASLGCRRAIGFGRMAPSPQPGSSARKASAIAG
jgi:hypothetical protein